MPEIVDPIFEVGKIVGISPATGIVAAVAGDGTVVVLEAWDPVQGDVSHTAPVGSVGGGGTRRHLFDREIYVDTGGAVYVNVRAWASITGKPTTIAGYAITDAITTAGGQTIAGQLTVTSLRAGAADWASTGQLRLPNDNVIAWRNAANSGNFTVRLNSSNRFALDAGLDVAGHLLPASDNAYDSGDSSTHRWRNGYFAGAVNTGTLAVSSTSAFSDYVVITGRSAGYAGASRYVQGYAAGIATNYTFGPDAATNGRWQLLSRRSDDTNSVLLIDVNAAATTMTFGANIVASGTLTTTGALAASAAFSAAGVATFNAGNQAVIINSAAGASKAAFIQINGTTAASAATIFFVGTNPVGTDGSFEIRNAAAGNHGLTIHGTTGVGTFTNGLAVTGTATHAGNLVPAADNAYDLAASSSFRWRDLQLAGNATVGGFVRITNSSTTYLALDTTGTAQNTVYYRQSGVSRWEHGTSTTVGTPTWYLYSYGLASNVVTFAYATGTATFGANVITATGSFFAGTSTVPSASVSGMVLSGQSNGTLSSSGASTTPWNHFLFMNGNGIVGSLSTNGSSTAYTTSSDIRLKNDLGIATDTSVLRALIIHKYEWKRDGTRGRGVFAQEAEKVAPWAVTVGADELDDDGYPVHPWSIEHGRFVPDLIVGWQDHERRIEFLEAENADLRARLTPAA